MRRYEEDEEAEAPGERGKRTKDGEEASIGG
jgi:hypothetical protein